MPNNNNYIAFDLDSTITNQFYLIGQEISSKIDNFSPFEFEQIHMTVCFLGELGKRIKTNKKETFEKLQLDIDNFTPIDNLVFDSYELFGSKNNLIVAKFKISKSDEKKVIQFKQYCSSTYGAPDENYYTPHITLGKILHYNDSNPININKLNISKPDTNIISNPKLKFV
jgi:2'-5' RNA ligase